MSTSHPSDEELSAHLDGEAPEIGAHIAACTACRSSVEELRRAVAMVAAAPPQSDDQTRDRAIARALAGDPVARPRRLALVAAAAAVVIAAGIATPFLLRGSSRHRTTSALSSSKAASEGLDIGDQSDPAALSSLVSAALAPVAGSQQLARGDSAAASAAGSATAPIPPTTIACSPPVDGGQVVYRATLRWKGMPAQLFAIQPERRLVVMDSAHCRVLVDRRF